MTLLETFYAQIAPNPFNSSSLPCREVFEIFICTSDRFFLVDSRGVVFGPHPPLLEKICFDRDFLINVAVDNS